MIKYFPLIIALLLGLSVRSQTQDTIVTGKIKADISELEGVHIINLRSEFGVLSQVGGYFKIPAKAGDTLMFSSVQFVGKRVAITADDILKPIFFVKLETMVNTLDEVDIVRYKNMNAVAMGIIPKGQKVYTPAERKLRTAGEFHWYSPLLIPLGGMSADGLINSISGRTDMLKKELVVEKKEFLLAKLDDMFKEEYYTQKLLIPAEHIGGFCRFLVESENLAAAVNSKNKTMAELVMAELAIEYLATLAPVEKVPVDE